jgi:hypothetical protein
MRHILNSSKVAAICGETHFFGSFLRQGLWDEFARVGDVSTEAGIDAVLDYVYLGRCSRSVCRTMREQIDREQFRQGLLASDRTERALFDLLMHHLSDRRPIRGEKTPDHIYHVSTLLGWYPEAKVIHTLRDPRAIFVSKRKKKSRAQRVSRHYELLRRSKGALDIYLSLNVLLHWKRIVRLHDRYQKAFPESYHLVRFEDLVSRPRASVTEICGFLDIPFEVGMLQQKVVKSSFLAEGEQIEGFQTSAIDRWRQHLQPGINRWFVAWCRRELLAFGYAL